MTAFEYLKKTEKKRTKELLQFLSFASVSAQSKHNKDVAACADWLKAHLTQIGFKTKLYPTKGHPVIFAEYFVDKKTTDRIVLWSLRRAAAGTARSLENSAV